MTLVNLHLNAVIWGYFDEKSDTAAYEVTQICYHFEYLFKVF